MIGRAATQGFVFQAAFENEFTLARKENGQYVPLDHSPCFSTIGMDSAAPVMTDVIEALVAQGVFPEQYYAELGPGQQELPVRFADALQAADNQITVRETARGVAARHGLLASFAPKPFPDQAGNGAHIHFSLWAADGEQNVFHDARGRYGLSDTGFAFIGGVLAHLPGLVALTAPTVNSYRRLQPRVWSSAYTAWGPDNREAAVRVPSKRRGIARLPTSLAAALDALERDDVLRDALGDVLAREYLTVKRSEVRAFEGQD